jgi:hypothetical protein
MELIMSNKTFEGNVSIVKNTKGEIALKRDHEGQFNAGNAVECYGKMQELAKKHKASINSYSLFLVEGGTEAVMLANRYGNPYIALLPKRDGTAKAKSKVTKLA